jgi:hypothetical protein
LLIALPWLITCPWFKQRGERLDPVDHPHVVQHLHEEAAVQQVQDRVLDAADVLGHRHPLPHGGRVEGPVLVGG